MTLEETALLIKKLKKQQIRLSEETGVVVDYGKQEIYTLIPHRPPFDLIDRIKMIDYQEKAIMAETTVQKDDPVFKGHFPDQPLYPGVLQIEMMGQVGLCLAGFVIHQTAESTQVKPVKGLFTRVHNAGFLSPVLPGCQLDILAELIQYDEFIGIVAAQIVREGQIVAHSISEVYFSD